VTSSLYSINMCSGTFRVFCFFSLWMPVLYIAFTLLNSLAFSRLPVPQRQTKHATRLDLHWTRANPRYAAFIQHLPRNCHISRGGLPLLGARSWCFQVGLSYLQISHQDIFLAIPNIVFFLLDYDNVFFYSGGPISPMVKPPLLISSGLYAMTR